MPILPGKRSGLMFYNSKRRHGFNGQLSLVEYEKRFTKRPLIEFCRRVAKPPKRQSLFWLKVHIYSNGKKHSEEEA